ncbi:hypothetical protein MN202_09490 [Rheinheimera muenzenbergensis]|uniref:Histidine kinase-, DNA gyrase B-, and HSP90-like ATPase n=1 Tax=Rheinheimera muenzenbergensis TaxID=1193628 RepID=A0ABU8C7I8_9GAMM
MDVNIPRNCSINFLQKKFNFSNEFKIIISKESSFSLGAEGFFISIINLLCKRNLLSSVRLYLAEYDIETHGINSDSSLVSAYFLAICLQGVDIEDRYGKKVTDLVQSKIDLLVKAEEGVFERSTEQFLYALDPYYTHPPKLLSENEEPSEESFKDLLKKRIENSFVSNTSSDQKRIFQITEKINLYVFLKEIWENTVHHGRTASRGLRYIKLSKIIFVNEEGLKKSRFPTAIEAYILHNMSQNRKRFIVIDIVDSGEGIYRELLRKSFNKNIIEVVSSAFEEGVTSKIARSSIRRGLGLSTALKCAADLEALLIMTTSGTLATNYSLTENKILNTVLVNQIDQEMIYSSTSVSLVIPT